MSNRNERGKPAFLAQEEALGGAHMILGDYVSLHRRAAGAVPTVGAVMACTDLSLHARFFELSP